MTNTLKSSLEELENILSRDGLTETEADTLACLKKLMRVVSSLVAIVAELKDQKCQK